MFGLENRGEMTIAVEDEFESLMSRLRTLWQAEHNEDGTHMGINFDGAVTNITVVNGIVMDAS